MLLDMAFGGVTVRPQRSGGRAGFVVVQPETGLGPEGFAHESRKSPHWVPRILRGCAAV